jgi:PAS domain S-box-containing protein
LDESGGFAGYRGTSRDVTERRRREEELAQFRAAMDASPDMMYVTDRETMRFLYANETACRLSGYSLAELLAIGPADVLARTRRRSSARSTKRSPRAPAAPSWR